jgi:hypothetical protein
MSHPSNPTTSCTAFDGHRRIASGPVAQVAIAVKRLQTSGSAGPFLTFDDQSGRAIDVDTRGSDDEITARLGAAATPTSALAPSPSSPADADLADRALAEPRGRGRPSLGVVAREITLLPRHWQWLATQPGGASVALRKLVDEARKTHAAQDAARVANDRAYHFMSAMAGNLAGFEEAIRALFANDARRCQEIIQDWPADVRDHALALARSGDQPTPQPPTA